MSGMPHPRVGQWGPLDECGARNLVDAAATLRGMLHYSQRARMVVGQFCGSHKRNLCSALHGKGRYFVVVGRHHHLLEQATL